MACYIERRDGGISCDPDNIYLTTGASDGIVVRPDDLTPSFCSLLAMNVPFDHTDIEIPMILLMLAVCTQLKVFEKMGVF